MNLMRGSRDSKVCLRRVKNFAALCRRNRLSYRLFKILRSYYCLLLQYLFTPFILQNYEVKHQEIMNQSKLLNKVSKLAQGLLEKSEDVPLKDYVPSVEELFNQKIVTSQVPISLLALLTSQNLLLINFPFL